MTVMTPRPPDSPPADPSAVSAPGKAMLIGEYAVLDGGVAAVAAVDCYAVAVASNLPEPSSPFIAAALRHARVALAGLGLPGDLHLPVPRVDTSAFARGGRKLGVGSSAAATVAAVGSLFRLSGLDPATHRADIQRTAAAAHDEAQGVRGSGADILAATWGGILTLPCPPAPVDTTRPAFPTRLRFIATAQSASTAALVARYRERGSAAARAGQAMAAAAERFLAAWSAADGAAVIAAVDEAFEAYLGLGYVLAQALITADHAAIHLAARHAGGSAKPSGAGGGDLAVAFLPSEDADAERAFFAALPPHLKPWPLAVSATGVQALRRSPSDEP